MSEKDDTSITPVPATPPAHAEAHAPVHQTADLDLSLGSAMSLAAQVRVTSGGLLAIGALVSSILLSTAVIVRTAKGGGPPPPPKGADSDHPN